VSSPHGREGEGGEGRSILTCSCAATRATDSSSIRAFALSSASRACRPRASVRNRTSLIPYGLSNLLVS